MIGKSKEIGTGNLKSNSKFPWPPLTDTLILVSIIYALLILLTGGFSLEVRGIHLTSRSLRNPLIITGILFLIRRFINKEKKPFLFVIREKYQKVITNSAFYIMALILSCYFMQLRFSMNLEYERATLSSLLNNTAMVPFQYRILIPWFVGSLSKILPLTAVRLFRLFEMFSTFFLIVAFRHYVSLFFRNKTVTTLLSFSLFYVLPFNFLLDRHFPLFYPSDTPSVLFFTLGLILLYKKNWPMYYLVFAVATLNRGTTCFLTFIYLFTAIGKSRPKTIVAHCVFQFVIWVTIKYSLHQLYAYCHGIRPLEYHWHGNFEAFADPRCYPHMLSSIGFIWIPTLFYFRSIRDDFVRRSLLVIVPFLSAIVYIPNIDELRCHQELIPVILMAFLLILRELFKRRLKHAGKYSVDCGGICHSEELSDEESL